MRRLLPLLCSLPLLIAGCGGGGAGDAGADPAAAMPAGAVFYADLVVRPEGDRREDMEALLGTILGTDDPGARITGFLDEQLRDEDRSYEEDIAPWLGERGGVAITSLAADEPSFTVAFAVRDGETAEELVIDEQREGRRSSHRGVEIAIDEDGTAGAVSGDYLLIAGSEADLKTAIDAGKDSPLSKSEVFRTAMDRLPEDREGSFFIDTGRFLDAVLQSPELRDQGLGPLQGLLGDGLGAVSGAVLAEADQLAIETRAPVPEGGGPLAGLTLGGATPLVGELPGDAWLALGLPDVGESLRAVVTSVAGAIGGAVLDEELRRAGVDLERDVYSWIGDVAMFVRGDAPQRIEGGVVIEATDPQKARAAITRLVGLAQAQGGANARPVRVPGADVAFALQLDIPLPLVVALGGERAVVAVGERAAAEGLKAPEALSDAEVWGRAEGVLDGLEPALVADARAIVSLLGGVAAGDPDFAAARPYLERIDVIAAGSARDEDVLRQRVAIGVGE